MRELRREHLQGQRLAGLGVLGAEDQAAPAAAEDRAELVVAERLAGEQRRLAPPGVKLPRPLGGAGRQGLGLPFGFLLFFVFVLAASGRALVDADRLVVVLLLLGPRLPEGLAGDTRLKAEVRVADPEDVTQAHLLTADLFAVDEGPESALGVLVDHHDLVPVDLQPAVDAGDVKVVQGDVGVFAPPAHGHGARRRRGLPHPL